MRGAFDPCASGRLDEGESDAPLWACVRPARRRRVGRAIMGLRPAGSGEPDAPCNKAALSGMIGKRGLCFELICWLAQVAAVRIEAHSTALVRRNHGPWAVSLA